MPVTTTQPVPGSTSFDDFDPNKVGKETPVWGVYDGSRFKTYATRGPALNATMHHWHTKLYRLNKSTGLWELLAVKHANNGRPTICDNCTASTMSYQSRWNYQTRQREVDTSNMINLGVYEWQRLGGKILDPPVLMFVCKGCQPQVAYA